MLRWGTVRCAMLWCVVAWCVEVWFRVVTCCAVVCCHALCYRCLLCPSVVSEVALRCGNFCDGTMARELQPHCIAVRCGRRLRGMAFCDALCCGGVSLCAKTQTHRTNAGISGVKFGCYFWGQIIDWEMSPTVEHGVIHIYICLQVCV